MMSEMSTRLPLLVVLGATGTGKSKLAIELAQKFAGEIISADSMQVYRGLDIVTAKVTAEERRQVPHHMMDMLDPHQEFTVQDFRNRALPLIDSIQRRGRMPVVVGGTNYYIEALLWKILVDNPAPQSDTDDATPPKLLRRNSVTSQLHSDLLLDNTNVSIRDDSSDTNECTKDTSADDREKPLDTSLNGSKKAGDLQCSEGQKSGVSQGEEEEDRRREVMKFAEEEQKELKDSEKDTEEELDQQGKRRDHTKKEDFLDVGSLSNEELHRRLQAVDPPMASGLHPNNRRKVLRSLELAAIGRKHSDLLEEQRRMPGGGVLGGPLRYPDAILLWLRCNQEVLDERLDRRVDGMLEAGLVDELLAFHDNYNQQRIKDGIAADYTRGVFQSIGFKEFHEYLMMSPEERSSQQGQAIFAKGVLDLKMVTRRYARRQNKWVRNRFLRRPGRQVPPLYGLDGSDLRDWDTSVRDIAISIVESRLSGTAPPVGPLPPEPPLIDNHESYTCSVCQRLFIGSLQWDIHQKSAKHQRVLKKLKRLAEKQTASDVISN